MNEKHSPNRGKGNFPWTPSPPQLEPKSSKAKHSEKDIKSLSLSLVWSGCDYIGGQ